jgi:hypothetical protein
MNVARQNGPPPVRRARACLGALILACAWPLPVGAQPERFNDVKAWRGSLVASAHGIYQQKTSQPNGDRAEINVTYDGVIWMDFLLDQFEDDMPPTWRGRVLNSNF